ncbi:hypothetical protein [Nostoc sp. ChiVER01]|uniref:hypothetical protein n=1 Tax=Nostoc sp. ChiVER01 TaxID=3075382 RepID=UPI002AD4C565|nr:hypothetical protein [Nostoc sp. ChiVER01]MDZ8226301.1 hypothetical protein [Nostoc sp. ChiVER01]
MFKIFSTKKQAIKQAPKLTKEDRELFEELDDADLLTIIGGVDANVSAEPCIGLSVKANVQSVIALVNVGVQDIPVLSNPQNQQCTEN